VSRAFFPFYVWTPSLSPLLLASDPASYSYGASSFLTSYCTALSILCETKAWLSSASASRPSAGPVKVWHLRSKRLASLPMVRPFAAPYWFYGFRPLCPPCLHSWFLHESLSPRSPCPHLRRLHQYRSRTNNREPALPMCEVQQPHPGNPRPLSAKFLVDISNQVPLKVSSTAM